MLSSRAVIAGNRLLSVVLSKKIVPKLPLGYISIDQRLNLQQLNWLMQLLRNQFLY